MKRNTFVLFAVLFLLAAFAWAGWANWEYRKQAAEARLASVAKGELVAGAGDIPQYSTPLLHKSAPDFTLPDLSGKKVSLASYKGKAVLINFWATWCGPCKIETPWLVELDKQYAPQGLQILGISTEGDDLKPGDKAGWATDKAAIEKFVQQEKVPYTMLMDGDSISNPYGGVEELPTSFFIDRSGTVVAAQLGLTSKEDIESNIRKALGEGK